MVKRHFVVWCMATATFFLTAVAQANDFISLQDLTQANTAGDVAFLSQEEKDIIMYCNLVRMKPAAFANTYLRPFVEETSKTLEADNILVRQIANSKPMEPLRPETGLCISARKQAYYLASQKNIEQAATASDPFYDRIHRYYPGSRVYAESWNYGSRDPLVVVLSLLLDTDDQYNILSPHLDLIGVSLHPSPEHCASTVLNLTRESPRQPNWSQRATPEKEEKVKKENCPHVKRHKQARKKKRQKQLEAILGKN